MVVENLLLSVGINNQSNVSKFLRLIVWSITHKKGAHLSSKHILPGVRAHPLILEVERVYRISNQGIRPINKQLKSLKA